MSERVKKFRMRGPSMSIENAEIKDEVRELAWQDAVEWFNRVKWQRVDSFRLQVNFRREPKPQKARPR